MGVDREELGRLVREIWVGWARENSPKPHHLWGWDELPEDLKEVDRRIGEQLFARGQRATVAALEAERLETAALPGDESIPREERVRARTALGAVPEGMRRFRVAHFQLIPETGKFVGLVCNACNQWQEYGHDADCAVAELERIAMKGGDAD